MIVCLTMPHGVCSWIILILLFVGALPSFFLTGKPKHPAVCSPIIPWTHGYNSGCIRFSYIYLQFAWYLSTIIFIYVHRIIYIYIYRLTIYIYYHMISPEYMVGSLYVFFKSLFWVLPPPDLPELEDLKSAILISGRKGVKQWVLCSLWTVISICIYIYTYLVGGLEHEFYDFPYIGDVIIPTDELIFFRGAEATNQTRWLVNFCNWTFFRNSNSGQVMTGILKLYRELYTYGYVWKWGIPPIIAI